MGLGFPEIVVIVLVILVVFGPAKIPELSRAIGRGMREFRKAMREIDDALEESAHSKQSAVDPAEKPPSPDPPA